jgi:DNA adenine methylase
VRYMGGKAKLGGWLREKIRPFVKPGARYVEPFLGGAGSFAAVAPMFDRRAAGDAHPELIAMWRAVAAGWAPPLPIDVTREDYARALAGEGEPHWRAWVLFGCSFGGKWRGGLHGFGRQMNKGKVTMVGATESLTKNRDLMASTDLRHCSFEAWDFGPGDVVYCDPPYTGTTGYSVDTPDPGPVFARWASAGAVVLVSEYAGRLGWSLIAEKVKRQACMGTSRLRFERLYRVHPAPRVAGQMSMLGAP